MLPIIDYATSWLKMAPPPETAELPVNVLPVTVMGPWLRITPPVELLVAPVESTAVLPVKLLLVTTRDPDE